MASDRINSRSHGGDDDPEFQAFAEEMEFKNSVKREKAEEQAAHKTLQRISKQTQWRRQLKRTQQYLGLRYREPHTAPTLSVGSIEAVCSNLANLTVTTHVADQNRGRSIHVYPNSPPVYSDNCVVFISVDIEAFEFNQKLITEIGVSTLSTAELFRIPPGAKGSNWIAMIRSRHFRIQEHSHRVNKVHVEGCPDQFDFGQSEWISKRDVISVLENCFHPYGSSYCQTVLVGHGIKADIKYLKELGLDMTRMTSDCVDTADLYKASRRDGIQIALKNLLLQYGIAAKHLHNAGNDAHYTLRVMVAIALDDIQNKKCAQQWEIEKAKRILAAYEVQKQRYALISRAGVRLKMRVSRRPRRSPQPLVNSKGAYPWRLMGHDVPPM